MKQSLDESLVRISKGTGIVFVGISVGLLLAFIARLLVARYATESDYGIFCLALVVLNIGALVGTLGLQEGASRNIAYARGENDREKIKWLISVSVWFALVTSLSLGLILFLASQTIAERILHDPALGFPLKIFATAIPFFTLTNVLTSIFRGFDQIKPRIYFQDILRNTLFVLFVLGITFIGLSFRWVFYAYLGSAVIILLSLVIYTINRLPSPIVFIPRATAKPIAKELLLFSLPLLGVAMLGMVITWTDTLMLGYFRTSVDVGLYNAAIPLAQLISFPLTAMLLIYMPVASGLYAHDLIPEMRRNFSILTKWLCSATLPLFLMLFIFPELVLNLFFGVNYTPAASALRILSLGFIINNLAGPNGSSLVAMGHAKFLMWTTLLVAILNIGLNAVLIPSLGLKGAAIASVAAIFLLNLVQCWKLYSLTRIQPLSKNLIKPALVSLALIFTIHFVFGDFIEVTLWMLPLIFILYYAIYGLAILFTKSFGQEDILLLLAVEKWTGLNAAPLKKILRKFL